MHFRQLLNSVDIGKAQEIRAARFLCSQGLRLICKNYPCRFGEIDLVMAETGTLVFVEVRYRKNGQFGGAAASVTPAKQRRIRLTAAHYLQAHPRLRHDSCRFDVLALSNGVRENRASKDRQARTQRIDWIKNAFV